MEKFESPENNSEVTIEKPSPKDALAIREVEYETWKETYPSKESGITEEDIDWYFKDFKKSFSEEELEQTEKELEELPENQQVLIARDNEKNVIAYAWLMKNSETNEIGALYVSPEHQREGIGGKMWNEAEKFFNENNDTLLTVAEHNKEAIAFYESLGFVNTGKHRSSLTFPSGAEFKEIEMRLP